MPTKSAPQTWRLVELLTPSANPCPACGDIHRYLMLRTPGGDCMPVLCPPGIAVPTNVGVEIAVHLAVPVERAVADHVPSRRNHQVAERVRATSIRCEGCGERFEELETYRVRECAVRYR